MLQTVLCDYKYDHIACFIMLIICYVMQTIWNAYLLIYSLVGYVFDMCICIADGATYNLTFITLASRFGFHR